MKTRLSFASIAIVLTLFSSLHAATATAAGEDPEELIREGVKLRRRGDNARAEGYFLRAYQLAATPRTAAQLGLAELALGEFLEAETHLSLALGARDAWVSEHKQALEDGRTSARKHLVRVELAPLPSETTAAYAGNPATTVPADGVIFLAAGKPATLRLEAPSHKGSVIQVEGAEGETRHVSVDMPLIPRPAPPPPAPVARSGEPPVTSSAQAATAEPSAPPPEATPAASTPPEAGPAAPGHGLRVAGIVVASVGVAAGIAGAVLLAQAGSKHDSLARDNDNKEGVLTLADFNSRNSSWKSEQTLGIACLVSGGVAIVGGVVLYAVGAQTRSKESAGASVSFLSGPGFGLVSLRGSF
jgi:hypothetical protein